MRKILVSIRFICVRTNVPHNTPAWLSWQYLPVRFELFITSLHLIHLVSTVRCRFLQWRSQSWAWPIWQIGGKSWYHAPVYSSSPRVYLLLPSGNLCCGGHEALIASLVLPIHCALLLFATQTFSQWYRVTCNLSRRCTLDHTSGCASYRLFRSSTLDHGNSVLNGIRMTEKKNRRALYPRHLTNSALNIIRMGNRRDFTQDSSDAESSTHLTELQNLLAQNRN